MHMEHGGRMLRHDARCPPSSDATFYADMLLRHAIITPLDYACQPRRHVVSPDIAATFAIIYYAMFSDAVARYDAAATATCRAIDAVTVPPRY